MARVWHNGAEFANAHTGLTSIADSGVTGTVTFDTGTMRSGSRSFKCDAGAGNAAADVFLFKSSALDRRNFLSVWFYVPNASGLPSSNAKIIQVTQSGNQQFAVRLTTAGKVQLLDHVDVQIGSDSAGTVATDTWHRIDLGWEISTGAADYAEARLDGVSAAATTTASVSDTAGPTIRFGWVSAPGASKVIYCDDATWNDDTGGVNDTWAGDEHIVVSRPTADSARDASWVAGAGGTTDLWEAVNNAPPVGVDNASATDTSQIKNATSTTTDAYSATMQSYTAAGVPSGATVTAIIAHIESASSSTTGTNDLGVEVTSNPAITEGILSCDAADGTFPTGWFSRQLTVADLPSVTLGTAPVMRVRKNQATTRVYSVCLMALEVSYVEAAASSRGPQVIWIG